ncbi:MAG: glycosyltransferase family 4 protein [Mycobacteriales bacterium]
MSHPRVRLGLLMEQCLAPVPGGSGRYAHEIARALAATAPAGATVTGWTAWHRDVSAARVDAVGGPCRLPLPRRPLAAAWERGVGPAPRGVDVVHATTPLAPPRGRWPLVVTVHDTVPWTHPETLTPRGAAWHRRVIGLAARHADRIVVPTQAMAVELSALVDVGDRLTVVGMGVGDSLALPVDADERAARLRLPAGGYWTCVATLEPRKGLDIAVEALAQPAAPGLSLVVVGPRGWGGVDIGSLARRHGLDTDRVRVLGALDDADLAVVLHRATALLAPSRAEGFGLPVLEAMSIGTPVISSDAPALVEVGGGATRIVARDDPGALAAAMAELAADPAELDRLRERGIARAAHFTWQRAAGALWGVYNELLG